MKKIDVKDLRLGMYVEALDRPWEGTPFLFQGFYLRSYEEIQTLQQLCTFVYVTAEAEHAASELSRKKDNKSVSENTVTVSASNHDLATFAREINDAKEIAAKTKASIDQMHDDIRKGKNLDIEGSRLTVSGIVQSIHQNPDALLWLTYLKNRDEYTALHSMNVSILSILFGHHLGLDGYLLKELGLGALLHDMGKLRVPLEILNKPDRLTSKEFELMQQHPAIGVKILQATKNLSSAVLDIVYSHHERLNGKGYPRGLQQSEISQFSRIVSIIDVYDALTSDRVYREGQPSPDVMRFMYGLRDQDFDSHLMSRFIQCLGIFPVGSLVELNTGEVGIVISHNRERPVKPTIMLILDRNKKKYHPLRIMDLMLFDKTSAKFSVKKGLATGAYGIDVEQYSKEIAFT